MRTSGIERGRALLEGGIKAFRAANPELPKAEDEVLHRLLTDRRATSAFAALPEGCQQAKILVLTCIEAAEILRIFDREVARSEQLLGTRRQRGELDRLKKGIVAFEKFLDDLRSQPVGRLVAQHVLPPDALSALRNSLLFARDIIEGERRIACETPMRLGATRKSRVKGAAQLAAIGWMSEGVRKIVGRPNRKIIVQLAEVVLQCSVTEARVREAERTRLERDWRMPVRSIDGQKPELGSILVITRRLEKSPRPSAVTLQPRLHERPRSK